MRFTHAALILFLAASSLYAQDSRRSDLTRDRYPAPVPVSDWPDMFPAVPGWSNANARPPGDVKPVSVGELLVPSKAAKEMQRSEKAFQAGDVRASTQHLRKAIEIYPEYLLAHNVLGTRYMLLGDYHGASMEFQKAAAIDSNSAPAYQSLSVASFFLASYSEAEAAARRALELDPESVGARYILARTLIAQRHATPEALELLHQSEHKFPNASLVLAQLSFGWGNTPQTIAELRQYLAAPVDQENKQKANCWLTQLTQAPLPPGCPAEPTRPNFR